jgi:hypothetical protein
MSQLKKTYSNAFLTPFFSLLALIVRKNPPAVCSNSASLSAARNSWLADRIDTVFADDLWR